jgi:two-component system response regulator ChvI
MGGMLGMPGRSSIQHNAPLIALVDDEESIRTLIGRALQQEGFRVESYADGEAAWDVFSRRLPDLVILDIIMPRIDGLELCRRIRALSAEIPLIFLSSKDEEFDRVLGLELGADDYLCKPFSTRELVARIKVLFRRLALGTGAAGAAGPEAEDLLCCGSLTLDGLRHRASYREAGLALTVTEFRILSALVRKPGHVKTRDQLLRAAYPHDQYMSDRAVDSHIKRIRRKIADVDQGFDGIETIYGLGYRYRPDS